MLASRPMQKITGLAAFAMTVGVKALAPKSHLTRPVHKTDAAAWFFETEPVVIDLTLEEAIDQLPAHARWYAAAGN
ncbi:MAG: hypothetical protein ACOYNI_07910 [Acidimicrobiia bacterium]